MFNDMLRYKLGDDIFKIRLCICPKYVVHTGDSPPHDIWEETQARQVNVTRWVAEAIARHIPGVPAYAAIGNHGELNLFEHPLQFIMFINKMKTETDTTRRTF